MIPRLRLELKKRAIRFALFGTIACSSEMRSIDELYQSYAICGSFKNRSPNH
jgi:hypothetical protein